jgi:hypothetical protein
VQIFISGCANSSSVATCDPTHSRVERTESSAC